MKVTVIGIEASKGKSNKTGKDYEMGTLHVATPLAAPFGEGTAKGAAGSSYRVPHDLAKGLAGNPLPFLAELELIDVIRFGKRESEVVSVKPLARAA